jgi:diguanylate cyclase (GGDEF)-like protein
MQSVLIGAVAVPGFFALLLFSVFTYLYRQTPQPYFRAWQLAWAAYCLEYALLAWLYYGNGGAGAWLGSKLFFCAVAVCLVVSTRLLEHGEFRPQWSDAAVSGALLLVLAQSFWVHMRGGRFHLEAQPIVEVEAAVALAILYCAWRFFREARNDSFGLKLLSVTLLAWVPLSLSRQFHDFFDRFFGNRGYFLGPLPQMLVALSMVVVLYEKERRVIQENALAFSSLDVDSGALLTPEQLAPAMRKVLERIMSVLRVQQGALCVAERWRPVLPSAGSGFSEEFPKLLESDGSGEYLSELAYRHGGLTTLRNLASMPEPLPAGAPGRFERSRELLSQFAVDSLTVLSLQTRDNNFGVVLLPHDRNRVLGTSQLRTLLSASMQVGMTLENYVVMHDAQRRTREYELLTQMGQVVSSRLDPDDVLRSIHKELGLLFDTETFYVAFIEDDEVRFEFESVSGHPRPKRSRKVANGLTEWVIRTGQPLLIRSDMEKTRAKLGVTFVPERPAKSYCAVPICSNNRPFGMMAAMNFDREFVYEQRDLELLHTAAGQVAVAIENARLFAEQQRRSRYLAFLNNVSKAAISSQDSEQLLAEIVAEIQHNFEFDHIGIGVLDYVSKEIEIKAEAGATAHAAGKRLPLGVGAIGRCARSNEMVLVQNGVDAYLQSVLPDARSVLCLPIAYSDSLLGVLNVESRRERAFPEQEVLILRTLAGLLATALHNAFVFQKLQQQSITDGLTGIKTRRFFLEALQSEWKRASRSGRPFSVALVDLDKFKDVNDGLGHLEGDLVLARVGRLLEQKSRQSNVVARYGGDEFVILMPETGVEQAQILAERLRLWVATDPMLSERRITGSFGVGSFPIHGATAEEVIRVADAGMYMSKHGGGNCVSIAEEYIGAESAVAQRQLLTAYVEGFLQREHTGPESVQEIVATLRKMCGTGTGRETIMDALLALSRAAESREVHAAGFGDRSARYVESVCRDLGITGDELMDSVYAARVHDVGKLIIPEKILCKPGALSEEEFYQVKLHPSTGAEIVSCIPDSELLHDIVKHHHERFDGTGYPDGLQGDEIPLGARILAVSDAYLTMTSDRPFAPRLSPEEAARELERCSGRQFDTRVVNAFLRQLKGELASARSTSL